MPFLQTLVASQFPLKQWVSFFARHALRNPKMIPLIEKYVSSTLKPLTSHSHNEKSIRLLVLNHHRFTGDLNTLKQHPQIEMVALPPSIQLLLNAIVPIPGDDSQYFDLTHPQTEKARLQRRAFLKVFLKRLCDHQQIHGVVTCSFYYVQDAEWDIACHEANILFIGLAKEAVRSSKVIRQKDRELFQKRPFRGHLLMVYGQQSYDDMLQANVCPKEKLFLLGTPRLDVLYQKSQNLKPSKKKRVTLFSFKHRLSAQRERTWSGIFSKDRQHGVVQLFEKTHAAIAELAQEYPDVEFIIKPKWKSNEWEEQIRDAIERESQIPIEAVPNLKISDEYHPQELIETSNVVVSFNSTTLLESRLLGKPTILVYFEEASSKYTDYVFFKEHFEQFLVATSKQMLKELVSEVLAEQSARVISSPPSQKMIKDYIGFFDGKTSTRFFNKISQTLTMLD